MLRMWASVILMGFCLGGCGSPPVPSVPNKIDKKIEEARRRREEPMKIANRIECQKNKGPHCLG